MLRARVTAKADCGEAYAKIVRRSVRRKGAQKKTREKEEAQFL